MSETEPPESLPAERAIPAGWYPVPEGQRYWDGSAWTEHVSPVPVQSMRPALITDRNQYDGSLMVVAWVIAVATAFYMLPWAVAMSRGKSNTAAIGIVNLLLGWTVIGWIAALVMACMPHQVAGVR